MSVRIQAPRYLTTAMASAGSDWLVFKLLGVLGLGPLGAQAVSRIVGGVTSFALNKTWTYESAGTGRTTEEALRFGVLYAVSYVLSLGLLYLAVEVLALPTDPSKLAADGLCFAVNFVAMRAWVFAAGGTQAEVAGK
ncbi:MAG: GtrA family protein [Alphaproteobacteria bacterium]|nr:GtrA family protein [Alphaproteobacteria bacterium]